MKCAKARELVPDYLSGSLGEDALAELHEHLEACSACQEEHSSLLGLWTKLGSLPAIEPSPAVDNRVQMMLRAYQTGLNQPSRQDDPPSLWTDWFSHRWHLRPVWQLVAVVLLFAGGLLAGWSLGSGGGDRGSVQEAEMSGLRREIQSLEEQITIALIQQQSVIERLRGVEWASRLEQPDDAILAALLRALDSDPNVNVRLAAVEALLPFARQTPVRRALLDSLPRQQSPLVQVELIDLMVRLEERGLVPVLESLIKNPTLDETVRERVKQGLAEFG